MPKKKKSCDLDSLAEAVIRNRNVSEMAEESGHDFTIYKVSDITRMLNALAEAQSNYQFMVDKACDEKLSAYREQAEAKAEAAERENALHRERFTICDQEYGEIAAERDRLAAALEKDQTGMAMALAKIRAEIKARSWLLEGRGPYEWDDHRYRNEAGQAMRAVDQLAESALLDGGRANYAVLAEAERLASDQERTA